MLYSWRQVRRSATADKVSTFLRIWSQSSSAKDSAGGVLVMVAGKGKRQRFIDLAAPPADMCPSPTAALRHARSLTSTLRAAPLLGAPAAPPFHSTSYHCWWTRYCRWKPGHHWPS